MELEDPCDGEKWLQPKSGANSGLGSSGDEELDSGDFVHIAGEYREDGRCRLFILALVEGIDDDQGWDVGGFERTDDESLHLRTKGVASGIGVCFQDRE